MNRPLNILTTILILILLVLAFLYTNGNLGLV